MQDPGHTAEKPAPISSKLDLFPYVNDVWVLAGMIGLSYIGIAITSFSPTMSYLYWLIIAPIFAIVCVVTHWSRAKDTGVRLSAVLRTQLFHWGGAMIATQLVYLLLSEGHINYESTGFIVLLILAFATFLEGVYLDWRFYIVGSFLALSLVLAVYVASYIWVLLIIGLLTLGAYAWLTRNRGGKPGVP